MSTAPLQFLLLVFAGWVNAGSARSSSSSKIDIWHRTGVVTAA
jgi:hypothetical protein